MCEVVGRLACSFLEQLGWVLINRLKEKSDRSWMQILLLLSLFVCMSFLGFFLCIRLFYFPLFSIPPFLFNLCLLPDLHLSSAFFLLIHLSIFHLSCPFSSSILSSIYIFLLGLFLFLLFCLPHLFSLRLRFTLSREQIISPVSEKWHHT